MLGPPSKLWHVIPMGGNEVLLTEEEIWQRYDDVESRLTSPVSERMLALCGLQPGMCLLDFATGRGEPAIRAARLVGDKGTVVGVDVSAELLAMARAKANQLELSNIDLRVGTAEDIDTLPGHFFHAVTIRWGLMYMNHPIAALTNARRSLRSDGRLVAALWAEPKRVSYFSVPRRLFERYRQLPPSDFRQHRTFNYSDPSRIEDDFTRSGFQIQHIEEMETPVIEAESTDDLVTWSRHLGLGRLLSELPKHDQDAWERDMLIELERHRQGNFARLGGTTRIVVAQPKQ